MYLIACEVINVFNLKETSNQLKITSLFLFSFITNVTNILMIILDYPY